MSRNQAVLNLSALPYRPVPPTASPVLPQTLFTPSFLSNKTGSKALPASPKTEVKAVSLVFEKSNFSNKKKRVKSKHGFKE